MDTAKQRPGATIDISRFDGFLIDLDGVVTETASVHAAAWEKMFNEYLLERVEHHGGTFRPFDPEDDYVRYVDGKPRFDGVGDFLQSRDIYLPPGEETDPPGAETLWGLGNRKNELFNQLILDNGVHTYAGSIGFIEELRARGIKVAVVTSSRNCAAVLRAANLTSLFDAQVDGLVARHWSLHGKPDPDTYLEAARRLGVDPARAVVIEDAISGVRAGRSGHFGLVVGVSRHDHPEDLCGGGADVVVNDLSELSLTVSVADTDRPSPLDRMDDIARRLSGRRAVVFIDYDGTLTPIVARPDLAILPDDMRGTLAALAERCPVVIISGRARADVAGKVGLGQIVYAGCHGFDIAGPPGTDIAHEEGAEFLPEIARAADELERRIGAVDGVLLENKAYDIAVHYRLVDETELPVVEAAVNEVLAQHPKLRRVDGKKVFELRPNMKWDKGTALLWLLGALGLDTSDVVPFYIGDDITDQDAFAAVAARGIPILVAANPEPTRAAYRLADPGEVGSFLDALIRCLDGDGDD